MSALNKDDGKLKLAVIEGWHPFEIPQWRDLFAGCDDMDCYLQSIDNWSVDCARCRRDYDVVLFYNMNMDLESAPFCEQLENALSELGSNEQGIVILHHGLLSYPQSQLWSEIVGIEKREFGYYPDQDLTIDVAQSRHPITKGIDRWEIHDETYTMNDAGDDSEVLLTAEHEKSMKTIAWTRRYQEARVFCFQCGHDHLAWENPVFRKILGRGIRWTARRL